MYKVIGILIHKTKEFHGFIPVKITWVLQRTGRK